MKALYKAPLKLLEIPRHSPVDFTSGPRLMPAPRTFSKEKAGMFTA